MTQEDQDLLQQIKKDINAVANIYPTAFKLYDEPLDRLASRILRTVQESRIPKGIRSFSQVQRTLEEAVTHVNFTISPTCKPDQVSSRVCKLGTKSCTLEH